MDSSKASNVLGIATPGHQLMFELFYPAVLGSLFYNLLPLLWDVLSGARLSEKYVLWKLLLAILIVCNFAIDFLLAKAIRNYMFGAFLIDIAVLFLLFKAFDSINIPDKGAPISARPLCLSYCGTFICFLFWTIYERKEHSRLSRLICFEIVAIAWFAIASWRVPLWFLAGSILVATIVLQRAVDWAKKPPFVTSSA